MKLLVNPHKITIEKTPVNEKEINVTQCEFEFADEITSDFVKDVFFTYDGVTYKMANIQNNKCNIPYEVLNKSGMVEIGVVAYLVEDEEEIKRYNPSPAYFNSWVGSLKDNYENSKPITPSDKEQFEQMLQDGLNDIAEAVENAERLDVDAEKVGGTATVTITKQNGTTKSVEINDGIDGQDGKDGKDGVSLEYKWAGTSLGIKREDEQNYEYTNLKGDKGEPGEIEFVVVNELPVTGSEGVIYLVPLETPESQENNYAEYIYINNNWELLGKIGIQVDLTDYALKSEIPTLLSQLADDSTHRLVTDTEKTTWGNKYDKPNTGIPSTDLSSGVQSSLGKADTALQSSDLTDYVKNTDYSTSSVAGVIKADTSYGFGVNASGKLYAPEMTYSQYQNSGVSVNIGKGTLENVLNARIGDISTAIDLINGESV